MKELGSTKVKRLVQLCLSIESVLYPNTKFKVFQLTVNSPVSGSNPTCNVCSKLSGGEITSLSGSFFFSLASAMRNITIFQYNKENKYVKYGGK